MKKRWVISSTFFLTLLSGCVLRPDAAPPSDFPKLFLPTKTVLMQVDAVKIEYQGELGIFLSEKDYDRTLVMVQGLIGERDALRDEIEKYNQWRDSRGK